MWGAPDSATRLGNGEPKTGEIRPDEKKGISDREGGRLSPRAGI